MKDKYQSFDLEAQNHSRICYKIAFECCFVYCAIAFAAGVALTIVGGIGSHCCIKLL